MNNTVKSISLFANAGIGEYYLHDVGIENVVANELLGERCRWYKTIYPHCTVVPGSITDKQVFEKLVQLAKENNVGLLTASPPCQGTTVANNSKDKWSILYHYLFCDVQKSLNDHNEHIGLNHVKQNPFPHTMP